MPSESNHPPVLRFIGALALIALLFVGIEILPLHFGSRQVPWEELWPLVRARLPRMSLIAVAAAGVLAFGKRGGGTSRSEDTESRP